MPRERQREHVRGRPGGRGRDAAPLRLLHVAQRRVGGDVIELVVRAGERRADGAHRRALRIGAEHRVRAGADADIDARRDDRLQGLAAALRVEHVEHEAVLLEDAGVLAKLGDALLPAAALPDRDLERVLRGRGGAQAGQQDGGGHDLGEREHLFSPWPAGWSIRAAIDASLLPAALSAPPSATKRDNAMLRYLAALALLAGSSTSRIS